ncbi:hypothetical protein D3C87_2089180 [compost metagenome]
MHRNDRSLQAHLTQIAKWRCKRAEHDDRIGLACLDLGRLRRGVGCGKLEFFDLYKFDVEVRSKL